MQGCPGRVQHFSRSEFPSAGRAPKDNLAIVPALFVPHDRGGTCAVDGDLGMARIFTIRCPTT